MFIDARRLQVGGAVFVTWVDLLGRLRPRTLDSVWDRLILGSQGYEYFVQAQQFKQFAVCKGVRPPVFALTVLHGIDWICRTFVGRKRFPQPIEEGVPMTKIRFNKTILTELAAAGEPMVIRDAIESSLTFKVGPKRAVFRFEK